MVGHLRGRVWAIPTPRLMSNSCPISCLHGLSEAQSPRASSSTAPGMGCGWMEATLASITPGEAGHTPGAGPLRKVPRL